MPCSFCHVGSHNINGCDSEIITILYERIKNIYLDYLRNNPSNIQSSFITSVTRRITVRGLRAVCARIGFSRTSSQIKIELIQLLYTYFNNSIHLGIPSIHASATRLPTEPDPIPDYAQDLNEDVATPTQEQSTFNWVIDRTPSPMSDFLIRMTAAHMPQDRDTADANFSTPIGRVPFRNGNEWIIVPREGQEMHRHRSILATNLLDQFDSVSSNIPFGQETPKYNIQPILVSDELEECIEECIEECAICYENIKCTDLVKLNCNHTFCGCCIKKTLKTQNIYHPPTCALCREKMSTFRIKNPEIFELVSEHCICIV